MVRNLDHRTLAFESLVNEQAELIAKFVDGMLQMGNERFSEEELESNLHSAVTIFRFISGSISISDPFY